MSNNNDNEMRVPPHSNDAETAVLGAMMLSNKAVGRALEMLDHTAFYKGAHREIFKAMAELFSDNEPIDQVSVINKLKQKNKIEKAGGAYYITGLVDSTPSAASIEYYSKIVLEKSLFRKLINVSNEIQADAYNAQESAFDILDRAEKKIFDISQNRAGDGPRSFVDILNEAFEHMDELHARDMHTTGVPTGLVDLDDKLSGLQRGDLVILAARPSMGKTALALTMARNAAVEYEIPIGFFSLEMPDYQLAMRLLCAEARVDAHKVRTGRLPDNQWQKLSTKVGQLSQAQIFIDDTPSMTMLEIRAKARRLKAEHDIQLLVVDYLQLIRGTKGENRQQEISEISRSMKALAKELDIPVLALSQLSRAVEKRTGSHVPRLSDLRESGAIEQDADVVLFIYRPILYAKKEDKDLESLDQNLEQKAEVVIGKQRNGPTGKVEMVFINKYARFENMAAHEDEIMEEAPF